MYIWKALVNKLHNCWDQLFISPIFLSSNSFFLPIYYAQGKSNILNDYLANYACELHTHAIYVLNYYLICVIVHTFYELLCIYDRCFCICNLYILYSVLRLSIHSAQICSYHSSTLFRTFVFQNYTSIADLS